MTPVATSRVGSVSIPAVGDLVMVQFIGGDINAPVIIGSLYSDEARPPVSADGQAIMHLPRGASDSDAVHIELHSGDRREKVIQYVYEKYGPAGAAMTANIRDDDPVVELDVDGGKAKLEIGRDGSVKLEATADIEIKGAANINVEAAGQLNLKGSVVNIN